MVRSYTIDTSVFMSSLIETEDDHLASKRLLDKLYIETRLLIVPTLLLPEVAGAILRGQEDKKKVKFAQDAILFLTRMPNLQFVPLDIQLAQLSSNVAIQYRLRCGDAVFVAVALHTDSILITLDKKQRERPAKELKTCTPTEALNELN